MSLEIQVRGEAGNQREERETGGEETRQRLRQSHVHTPHNHTHTPQSVLTMTLWVMDFFSPSGEICRSSATTLISWALTTDATSWPSACITAHSETLSVARRSHMVELCRALYGGHLIHRGYEEGRSYQQGGGAE